MDDNGNQALDAELRRSAQLEWPRYLGSTSVHEFAHLHVAGHFGIHDDFGAGEIEDVPDLGSMISKHRLVIAETLDVLEKSLGESAA